VATTSGGSYSDAAGCTAATTSTGLTCTASGLTNGTAYSFKVAAINAAGTGPYSSASAAVTPGVTYALGSIGPGGGKVFHVALSPFACGPTLNGACTYLEMAPKNWSGEATDPGDEWCSSKTTSSGGTRTAIGGGAENMTAMLTTTSTFGACTASAANAASAFRGGLMDDWYLPSKDELNAMCNYVRTWTGTPSAPPTGSCTGTSATYASGDFGFDSGWYWTSSETAVSTAAVQRIDNASLNNGIKDNNAVQVRPIRAF
jgi:hypothetical protein